MRPHHIVSFATFFALAGTASAQKTLQSVQGLASQEALGTSVGGAGDVNSDGFADFIVGVPGTGTTMAGKARVYSGKDGSLLLTLAGSGPGDAFGAAVAAAGDVNNDGTVDLIVGAPHDGTAGPDAGRAYVFSGKGGAPLWTLDGATSGHELFGKSVAGVGDLNADGFDDFAVGAPFDPASTNPDVGRCVVYSGKLGTPLFTFVGDTDGAQLGFSVSGTGDVNGDGTPDVLVGAPGDDVDGDDAGLARVFSGKNGSKLFEQFGESAGDLLGTSVAGVGDVNGDAKPDLIVGVPGDNKTGVQTGSAWVLSGAAGTPLALLIGDTPGENFGAFVAATGDTNGDSFADYAVGAPFDQKNLVVLGSASFFSGRDGTLLYTFFGTAILDGAAVVAGVGDVDGDGLDDVIVGAPGADAGGTGAGAARVSSLVPAGIQKFGTGTPGCNGSHFINASEPPSINRVFFKLTCKNAPPSSEGVAVVTNLGNVDGYDPIALGITMYVDLFNSQAINGYIAQSGTTGYGQAVIDIPQMPEYVGLTCYGQMFWKWNGPCSPSPFGLSATEGLKITIQP